MGSLVGLTIWSKDYGNSTHYEETTTHSSSHPDKMVAYFSMVHVGIWILVGIFDRYMMSDSRFGYTSNILTLELSSGVTRLFEGKDTSSSIVK